PTFLLWRRMKLWELRSYDQVIKLEQERLVYQARLHSRFGRGWRRKAPVESLMPLRLARYGVPLTETAPAGLAAAGIEPVLLPPVPQQPQLPAAGPVAAATDAAPAVAGAVPVPQQAAPAGDQRQGPPVDDQSPWFQAQQQAEYHGGYDPAFTPPPEPQYVPEEEYGEWYEEQQPEDFQQPSPEETGSFPIPVSPGRTRELGEGGGTPEPQPTEEDFYLVFRKSIDGSYPTGAQFKDDVEATFGITLAANDANRMVNRFTNRHTAELEEDHIA
ncbi:hypothetical protein ACIQB5_47040, partial [Streptomyces sp. NPDC088560]